MHWDVLRWILLMIIQYCIRYWLGVVRQQEITLSEFDPDLGHYAASRIYIYPGNKVHGANMGPTWVMSVPDGPHVGPMNFAIRVALTPKTIISRWKLLKVWWRHQMKIFSALLALCVGNAPVTDRPVTRSFDVFFDLRLNKRLSKQSWGWWF